MGAAPVKPHNRHLFRLSVVGGFGRARLYAGLAAGFEDGPRLVQTRLRVGLPPEYSDAGLAFAEDSLGESMKKAADEIVRRPQYLS